jgi:cytoskeletal protein RodZ
MTAVEIGKKLKKTRLSAGRNVSGVAAELKIDQRLLTEFESGQFKLDEMNTHQRGYLRSYTLLLDLDWAEISGSTISTGSTQLARPQHQRLKSWVLSQKLRRAWVLVIVVVGLSGIVWTASQLFLAPELTISQPTQAQLKQDSRQLMVTGKTSPGSDVVINDVPVAVGLSGEFEERVLLARGVNRVQVRAINSLSREALQEFVVIVDATPGTDNE